MFEKKKDTESTEPFDPESYEPEPSDHFGDSVNDMSKSFAIGGAALAVLYVLKNMYESGTFN